MPGHIRDDNSVAVIGKECDGILPVGTKEILAMQQQYGFTNPATARWNVHIGHLQILTLNG
jgi:hypothetical protein